MPNTTYLTLAARGARTVVAVCALLGEHGDAAQPHVQARLSAPDTVADLLALRDFIDAIVDVAITTNPPDHA